MSDTFLQEDHPRIISAKFGWDWLSSFRGEDFFLISSPLFSNLHNRQKFIKNPVIYVKKLIIMLIQFKFGTLWLKIEQFWPFEEISIFSNGGHLGWRAWLSDIILTGTHLGTIPARFGLIWFSGFRGEDLNVIFYQNMPNLHNRYKSAERKISHKNQGFQSFL